ncbi:helix-turn-helix domain-containing protein [Devosia sp. ZB163]|uniref:helix-turn-helix domain-containing protein n=1 Tax=Devosia sp. ZB163 TaxID=3025938 RepID=UPI002362EC21|nr:helix-turn-helix domain-containing protein [Devosia sp. ZB163]MDC9823780.1 helix-turn-helix domain-containing protein [Devosia sp. ZB163]
MHIQPSFRVNRTNDANAGLSDLLTAMQPAAVTFYPAEATIYAQGETAGPLYLVEFGMIRICRMTADGRRLVCAFHTAGEVFGFEADGTHDSYAESVDGAGIRVLRPSCGAQPAGSLLMVALKGLARMQSHLMLLGRRTANERMAALLLDLAERQGDARSVYLAMPRNDIADYLGMTFETVSRVLRALKEQGLIRLRSISEVELLDVAALEAMTD